MKMWAVTMRPHLAFRHSGSADYACDIHGSDGRRMATVPVERGERLVTPDDAMKILELLTLLEKYPPYEGRKQGRKCKGMLNEPR